MAGFVLANKNNPLTTELHFRPKTTSAAFVTEKIPQLPAGKTVFLCIKPAIMAAPRIRPCCHPLG